MMTNIGGWTLMGLLMLQVVPSMAAEWEIYPGFQGLVYGGIVIGDFDGNEELEAAFTANTGVNDYPNVSSQLLAVLGAEAPGQVKVDAVSMLPARTMGPMVLVPSAGGVDRVAVVVGESGEEQILILGGIPLRVVRTIEAPMVRRLAGIVDMDADGQPEIMATTWDGYQGYPVILDYETGAISWVGDDLTFSVATTQLDSDPALELILAGYPARILDGASHASEWVYPSGFEGPVLVGQFDSDPNVRTFAVANGDLVQIFRGQPYSPISEFSTDSGRAVSVATSTADGVDQIAVAQWDRLSIHDPRDGHVTIEIDEAVSDAIAFGDIDGDSHVEVIVGGYPTSPSRSAVQVIDLDTLIMELAVPVARGPFSAIARDDIGGTGTDQVAYLSYLESINGYRLEVVDAGDGTTLHTREEAFISPTQRTLPNMSIAQLDSDTQMEIVVSRDVDYRGEITVFDGTNLTDQWRVGGYESVFSDVEIKALAIVDQNNDDVPDIAVATSGVRLVVLDGRNGNLLWESVTLYGGDMPRLATFHSEVGTPVALLTLGNGLFAFDLATGLLADSLKNVAGITGLWQWGDHAGCRFATLDGNWVVTVYRCAGLEEIGNYPVPEGTTFFRPIYDGAPRFLVASGTRLYVSDASGITFPVSGNLGHQIGADNHGVLRPGADADHFDLVIGSDYMVTRMTISATDVVFANGFE